MLYMIDRRPVIICALYLSIQSVFVDVIYTLCKSSVVFFIIEQWFAFLLSLVPSIHHAEAHFTLAISAHPTITIVMLAVAIVTYL